MTPLGRTRRPNQSRKKPRSLQAAEHSKTNLASSTDTVILPYDASLYECYTIEVAEVKRAKTFTRPQ